MENGKSKMKNQPRISLIHTNKKCTKKLLSTIDCPLSIVNCTL